MMMRSILLVLGAVLVFSQSGLADIVRFQEAAPGIYRGGQPETAADYDMLQSLGVRTIINLRSDETVAVESEVAKLREIEFISAPMKGFTAPKDETVELALTTLMDPGFYPVFIHCKQGKDRTGLVVGLYRVYHDGWKPRAAYKEMRKIGFNHWLLGLDVYYWWHTVFSKHPYLESDSI
ncbi:tyrosine-protein phosphatase [Bdellovibrionota bacterium FG-2]